MRSSTDIIKLPKARGAGYKWPKLTEAYRHFFGVDFADAHRAISDSRACKEIYFHLNPPVKPVQSSAAGDVSADDFTPPPAL
jgi:DNA polymerase III epsilon subunit-like protein